MGATLVEDRMQLACLPRRCTVQNICHFRSRCLFELLDSNREFVPYECDSHIASVLDWRTRNDTRTQPFRETASIGAHQNRLVDSFLKMSDAGDVIASS